MTLFVLLAVLSAALRSVFAAFQNPPHPHHGRKSAVFVFAGFLLLTGGTARAQGPVAADRAALVTLYNATAGANWTNNANWLSNEALSEWHGVDTDATGRVTELHLSGNELSGSITAELGSLTNLQRLHLYDNSINWPRILMNVSSTRQLPPTSRSPWFVPPGVRTTQQEDLNVGEPRTVRLIYFLPRDRQPQLFIDGKLDALIKDVQQSYAEQMENHGFGRRTFRYETDVTGKAVVHHVKGEFDDAYYHTDTFGKVIWTETAEQFDLSRNVYLVVPDLSTAVVDGYCGQGNSVGREGGAVIVPAPNRVLERERGWSCFNVAVTAHELGHAFGLAHDHFRNATRTPSSYHTDGMVTSSCAVEWLDAHRYFNIGRTNPDADEPTTIRMLPPLPVPPYSIRLRFEITDSDGLHQAQLHNSTGEAIDCQTTNGESAPAEFVTSEVTEAPGNAVTLRVVDGYGNITEQRYPIDLTALLTPEVVSIPDANLAAVVRETLGLAPGDAVTQLDMLRLRHLEAPARQITDLTGLEHAVNLKGLSLGENQIRDITPLAGSTILEVLELNANSISDLSPLAGMTKLGTLILGGNSVSDLSPLVGLTGATHLELYNNSISDLSPLAGLSNLAHLELHQNSVSDLSPLAALSHLRSVYLWGNPLSDRSINTYIPFLHSRGVTVRYEKLRWALNFAHFANGGLITSDLVLLNAGSDPIRPAIYFYDQEGEPIAVRSVVDLTPDMEILEDSALSVRTAMEPLGELTISTHGRGNLRAGSVTVVAAGSIGGVLRFDIPGLGVAGVGDSQPVRNAIFPVRRQEGGINTGVAIRNQGEAALLVQCHLMRAGAVLEAVDIPLKANGQYARFIDQVFTGTDTADFVGSVRCMVPDPGRFSAIALELDAVNRIFTTLPVVEVNRGRAGATTLDFAHFANGTWITDLVFVNLETRQSGPALTPFHQAIPPTRPVIYFYDTEGNPIPAESVVDITGDLEVTEGGALTVRTEMEPLGVLTISTHGRGDLVSGSVRVVSEGPIGGLLRFDHPGIGVAAMGASTPVSDAIFPVRRQEGGITTGVAIHNLESSPGPVRCELMREGRLFDAVSVPLGTNGQTAWFIDTAFPATDTSDFVGSVRCTSTGEGLFTAVALELDAGNRIFTTLPVVAVPERMAQE